MQHLRFSINVTLDGCYDHRVGIVRRAIEVRHLKLVSRHELGSGAVAMRYEPRRP